MKKFTLLALVAFGLVNAPRWACAQAFTGLQSGGTALSVFTAPGAGPTSYNITGTTGGEALVSIDYFTSSNSGLFGMAASGNLYSLNPSGATYTATLSNTLGVAGVTTIDFNPSANRLRVYAGTSNYRITPGAGGMITSDGMLAYNAGDANVAATPALRANAYTNNFPGSTSTALYSLDTSLDTLVLNTGSPAFSGLTTVAVLKLGGVQFDIVPGTTGFDITSIGGTNIAYVTKGNVLYTVDLASGALTLVGTQAGGALIDVAFVPEPGTWAMMIVGTGLLGLMLYRQRRNRQA